MRRPARVSLLLLALLALAALAQTNPLSGSPLSSIFDQVAGQAESGQPAAKAAVSEKVLTYKPSPQVSAELRAGAGR